MTRLLMLVEGQSEEIFVKHTLTPHLAQHGVYVQSPIVLWTKRLLRTLSKRISGRPILQKSYAVPCRKQVLQN